MGLAQGKHFLRTVRQGTGNADLSRGNGSERRKEMDREESAKTDTYRAGPGGDRKTPGFFL